MKQILRLGVPFDFAFLVGILLVFLSGCSREQSAQQAGVTTTDDSGQVSVYVVNYPLQYFAQRIGGDHVSVTLAAPSGGELSSWLPNAETIAALQQADLILLNGANYAGWIDSVTLPEDRLIDTSASFADQYIEVTQAVTHKHGPDAENANATIAFTTWLDPQLAIAQADAIRAAFTAIRPGLQREFQPGFDALQADLTDLDQQLTSALEGAKDTPLIFSRPVYQYLQRRHELNAKTVDWEPGNVPTNNQRAELAKLLNTHPAKAIVWESDPIDANMMIAVDLGMRSVVLDPCGNKPADGDYLSVMESNAQNLGSALQAQP